MKKCFNIIIIAILFISTSCENWLEIQPMNNVTEKKLFESSYGFRASLNSMYYSMASTELYGKEMSFGFVDILSKQYNINGTINLPVYEDIDNFNFKPTLVKGIIDKIWDRSYNIIANANNLIRSIENAPCSSFERDTAEKNMIHGEALAIRAMLHFDMLRLFAPAPINDDNKNYIPYVETFPNVKPLSTTVDDCISKIIRDLEKAEQLTILHDTSELGLDAVINEGARFLSDHYGSLDGTSGKQINVFFKNRGYRLHHDAVVALLARAYQYAGQHDKALVCAEKVINKESDEGKVYDFNIDGIDHAQSINNFPTLLYAWDQKSNLRLLKNLIFAVHDPGLYAKNTVVRHYTRNLVSTVSNSFFTLNSVNQKVFFTSDNDDETGDDIRSKYLIFQANDWNNPISGKWYSSSDFSKTKNNINILPMIRLTEMYYIAAESYARAGDFVKAKELLEKVREERNCWRSLTIADWEDFQRELVIDARREWIAEGQLMYLFKRLNAPVDFTNGKAPRPLSKNECVVPIPENQSI